jgi:TPR repeat protein
LTIRVILITALFLAAASSARAGSKGDIVAELQPAQKALASGEYKKAYARFSRFAAKNPLAQFNLALFYKYGLGRPVNEVEACRWFGKAARRNIPAAQHSFGDCLARGVHQPADIPAAIDWYKKAAANGHLISLCSAGDLYIKGKGVARDTQQGLALCAQAARQEAPLAMLKLAGYYREGTDVKQDLAAARFWYQQAAERHSHEAQYYLGVMLSEGQGGEPDLNAALFWLETAAGEGYAPAYLPTAILYANANPVPETGVLAPEHLAKIYLWLSAAKANPAEKAQLAEIIRIEAMVLAVMPASWRGPLDRKIAEHLAKYAGNKGPGQQEYDRK